MVKPMLSICLVLRNSSLLSLFIWAMIMGVVRSLLSDDSFRELHKSYMGQGIQERTK